MANEQKKDFLKDIPAYIIDLMDPRMMELLATTCSKELFLKAKKFMEESCYANVFAGLHSCTELDMSLVKKISDRMRVDGKFRFFVDRLWYRLENAGERFMEESNYINGDCYSPLYDVSHINYFDSYNTPEYLCSTLHAPLLKRMLSDPSCYYDYRALQDVLSEARKRLCSLAKFDSRSNLDFAIYMADERLEARLREVHCMFCKVEDRIVCVARNYESAKCWARNFECESFIYCFRSRGYPDFYKYVCYGEKHRYVMGAVSGAILRMAIDAVDDWYLELARHPEALKHFENSMAPGKSASYRREERVLAGL